MASVPGLIDIVSRPYSDDDKARMKANQEAKEAGYAATLKAYEFWLKKHTDLNAELTQINFRAGELRNRQAEIAAEVSKLTTRHDGELTVREVAKFDTANAENARINAELGILSPKIEKIKNKLADIGPRFQYMCAKKVHMDEMKKLDQLNAQETEANDRFNAANLEWHAAKKNKEQARAACELQGRLVLTAKKAINDLLMGKGEGDLTEGGQ